MPEMTPDLVVVEVIRQGEHLPYRVSLQMPGGGVVYDELDLAALRSRLTEVDDVWLTGSPATYGRVLYEGLFPRQLAYYYGAALGAAGERGIRLLLKLDDQDLDLSSVQWERLYQPQGNGWTPVAAASNVLFSRFLETGKEWGLPRASGSLRVLVVISAPYPPKHPHFIDAEAERAAIARAFEQFPGRIQYGFLRGPITLEAIAAALDAGDGYDVLHFAGHGAWMHDEHPACLILEETDAAGVHAKAVSGQEIVDRLCLVHRLPRLIALFACETAEQPVDGDSSPYAASRVFTGLGPQLVRAGCPAVICMQGQIEDEIARHFLERFYAALLDSGMVDLAMNRARSSVLERWTWQWTLPVLFMRLVNGVLFQPERRFVDSVLKPYKGPIAFTREDTAIFMGRSGEITEICARIADFSLTVVHGEPGSGLSSLMAAGVRPRLETEGDLVVPCSQYPDLALEARRGLAVAGWTAPLPVVGNASLAAIVQATFVRRYRRRLLMLDQAERIVDLLPNVQTLMIADLADCLDCCGNTLRIVFAVHDDAQPALLDLLRPLCRWQLATVPLLPLSFQGAVEAIIRPLEVLNWPVAFSPKSLASDSIVPELVELSNKNGRIDPMSLQVVCERLFHEAYRADRVITNELYAHLNWAEGMLAAHAEEKLVQLGTDRPAAEHILAGIAAAPGERWVAAERLASVSQFAVGERVLRRLLDSDLLIERHVDGQRAYAFANPVIADKARHLHGTAQQLSAEGEIDRIWKEWLERNAVAARGQLRHLRHLIGTGADPKFEPTQALLLLRSAVMHDEPLDTWLKCLDAPSTKALVAQLERPSSLVDTEMRVGRSMLQKGARVLGARLPEVDQDCRAFGAVAEAAVAPDAQADARRTSALALTALGPAEAVDRLRWAMDAAPQGGRGWLGRLELRGTLIDVHPETSEYRSGLSGMDRVGIWLWQVWRRILRDRHHLAVLTIGGALGAAVALGFLRYTTSILLSDRFTVGLQAAMYVVWGLLLGSSTSFGLQLAHILVPSGQGTDEGTSTNGVTPRWFAFVSVGFGALCFGAMHAFVAQLGGVTGTMVMPVIGMGFVAGLALSLAVYGLPNRSGRVGLARWLVRLSISALGFAIAHLPFLLKQYAGGSLAIVWSGETYCTHPPDVFLTVLPDCENVPALLAALGLIDAALVGAFLALGLGSGLLVANRWLRRLDDLAARAGD